MEKDGLLTLAETNKGLVAQLVELATLKDELWTLRNKVHPTCDDTGFCPMWDTPPLGGLQCYPGYAGANCSAVACPSL